MSVIDRLSIQGVRSFSSKHQQVVKVFTPLTLIVGQNGTGKTTIIECLRYATTGELPPNSATGGAWLQDPKLNGESETLAQVRLSFKNPEGVDMIVNRKLQLTVKKTQRTQKTLEGQLVVKNPNGERTVTSSRVAELDNLVPQHLGVSKVILEAVIFCHQDESLWPMNAPAMLKKRFDEIFAAHRYTKAVDNMKALRKVEIEKHGKLVIEERHALGAKEKAERVEKNMQQLYDEIEEHRAEAETLRVEMAAAAEKSEAAYNSAASFGNLINELENKRGRAAEIEQNIQSIELNLRKMTETDQELQKMQNEYEAHVARLTADKETLAMQLTDSNAGMEILRKNLGTKLVEVGRLESEVQRFESQLQSRKDLVKQIAARDKIWDIDPEINEAAVNHFMDDLNRTCREQQSAYNKARQEMRDKIATLQKTLDTLNERRSGLVRDKASYREKLEANEKRVSELQIQINKIDVDEGGKAVLQAHLEETEYKLQKAKSEFESAKWSTKLEEMTQKLAALNDKKDRLEAEQTEAARQAADLGQLDYLVKELKDKKKWLETNSKSYDAEFKTLLTATWTPENLEEQYKIALGDRIEGLKDAEVCRDRLLREHENCQFQAKEASKLLETKRRKIVESEQKIREVIEDEPANFPDILDQAQANWSVRTEDKANFGSMIDYYGKCADFAEKKSICRLCERVLKPTEKTRFMERLQTLRNTKEIEKIDEELKFFEQELAGYRAINSTYESWAQLSSEVAEDESVVAGHECRRDGIIPKLEEAQEQVKLQKSRQFELEALNKAVQGIVKCQNDITKYTSQLKELESKKLAGSSRAPVAIQYDFKKVNAEVKTITSQQEQARTHKERMQAQISSLEIALRDDRAKLAEAQHSLKAKETLETQIASCRTDNDLQRSRVKKVDEDIQPVLTEVSSVQQLVEDNTQRGAAREQELLSDLSRTKESIHKIELASKEINEFVSRGGPQQLARGTREMEAIKKKIEDADQGITQTGREMDKVETELRNNDDTKRAIADNLNYRKNKEALESWKQEVARLEKSNSAADKARLDQEAKKWQIRRNELAAEEASISGIMRTKDEQLRKLDQEWKEEYRGAPEKYKKARIGASVTMTGCQDLAKYAAALEKAIMKFHNLRMEEVNNTIGTLWRQTYRGTDVDTIMIRSEHESGKGNKSYNYRVVMVKQNTEMDMRGRCSAGQKVLASIIIRLALAECFSTKCGIIALDEPTTNLDRDNITSLARSLSELIKSRRNQKNFQLIIITHDEDFVREMNCTEHADAYFHVSRDINQKSIIKSQNISLI